MEVDGGGRETNSTELAFCVLFIVICPRLQVDRILYRQTLYFSHTPYRSYASPVSVSCDVSSQNLRSPELTQYVHF